MMGLGNVGGLGRLGYAAANSVGWWLSESQLDLDFANDRSYNRKTGYQASPNGLLTYTSPSPKMVYGANGVLGYAPHNLRTYSEQFDNAVWGDSATSRAANTVTAPNGSLTGDTLTEDGTNNIHRMSTFTSYVTGISYTWSVYAKSNGRFLYINAGSAIGARAVFDLSLGVCSSVTGTSTISDAGNGWYRCTVTGVGATTGSTSAFFQINDTYTAADRTYTGNSSSGLHLWGAQLNLGGVALDYLATTSAAKYDLPIDYHPTTHAPLGVLIEEQRTNLLTYSQEFDNATWTKDELTVSANAIVAPDGTTTADKLIPSTNSVASHRARQAYTFSAISYSYSVYVKAAGYSWVKLRFASVWANINVSTGAVGFSSGATVTVEDIGDGWYRCVVVGTAGAGASFTYAYAMSSNENSIDPTTWSGDGTSGIYLWGAQLEAGAFATSYIQTGSAQVTRAADQVTLATSAFNYGAAEGTLVTASDTGQMSGSAYSYIVSFGDGTANERIVTRSLNTQSEMAVVDGGVVQAAVVRAGTVTANTILHLASAYAADSFAVSANGGVVGTDNSGTIPTVTTLKLGADSAATGTLNGHVKRLTYWNSRKANAELQALSA